MDFLKGIDLSPRAIFRIGIFIVLAVFIVSFLFSIYRSMYSFVPMMQGNTSAYRDSAQASMPMMGYQEYDAGNIAFMKSAPSLSLRNMTGMPSMGSGSYGGNAEMYEAKDYIITYEVLNKDSHCAAIGNLKQLSEVVFENSNTTDTGCSFVFKVEHSKVDAILDTLKDLDPRELVESGYTVEKEITDYSSAEDILKKKQASIEEAMLRATDAYDELTELATGTRDVEVLSKILDSRLMMIERLTSEKLLIHAQLDELQRAKRIALDRVDYARISVSVYESRYIDLESIQDSWKFALQKFVRDVNIALQNATINLLGLFITLFPYFIFFGIVVIGGKRVFLYMRKIWEM